MSSASARLELRQNRDRPRLDRSSIRQHVLRRPKPSRDMTTCVATICEGWQTIIGASDRMITIDVTEYEPAGESKVIRFTNSIAMMYAGDVALQSEIMHDVAAIVRAEVSAKPDEWL